MNCYRTQDSQWKSNPLPLTHDLSLTHDHTSLLTEQLLRNTLKPVREAGFTSQKLLTLPLRAYLCFNKLCFALRPAVVVCKFFLAITRTKTAGLGLTVQANQVTERFRVRSFQLIHLTVYQYSLEKTDTSQYLLLLSQEKVLSLHIWHFAFLFSTLTYFTDLIIKGIVIMSLHCSEISGVFHLIICWKLCLVLEKECSVIA